VLADTTMPEQALFATLHPQDAEPRRFCLWFQAGSAPRGLVVHVAPFAEELNKTRRMVSQQARLLARAGFDVLIPDLLGCGDSPGHFEDANWDTWRRDVIAAAAWLRQQHRAQKPPLWLWGTRLGALLATDVARACDAKGLLLWQPVLDGSRHLQQFLRIADTQTNRALSNVRGGASVTQRLDAGEAVDVAGYRISPELARGLRDAHISTPGCRIICVQQRLPQGMADPLQALRSHADRWQDTSTTVQFLDAAGPAFWHQVEAEDAEDWWAVTTKVMAGTAA
jgi:exosortase A-associated hydrolase 2